MYHSFYTSQSRDSEEWDVYREVQVDGYSDPIDGTQVHIAHVHDEKSADLIANLLYAHYLANPIPIELPSSAPRGA